MKLQEFQDEELVKEIRERLADIHQYQKDVYEFCLNNGKLYRNKIHKRTVYEIVGSHQKLSPERLRQLVDELLTEDRIRFIERIEYVGDPNASEDSYRIDRESGNITVNVAPIEPDIEDNAFINDYLTSTFGEYASFIKMYMAAYTYTNFQRLPVLVFYGPRGTSKSTFADYMVRPIFPNMHIDWNGLDNDFNPEVEKKLAVIEENASLSKQQYNQIKSVTGSENLFLNQKYQEKVAVRNNLQIVLISNKNVPMYVEPNEFPLNELENQWFVWRFSKTFDSPDPNFGDELKARLGHYIRTELKALYEQDESLFSEGRYGIRTPITDYEKNLFEANRSSAELVGQKIITEILEDYEQCYPHLVTESNTALPGMSQAMSDSFQLLHEKNFLTNKLLKWYDLEDLRLASVVQALRSEGILGDAGREYLNSEEYRGKNIENWEDLEELKNSLQNEP